MQHVLERVYRGLMQGINSLLPEKDIPIDQGSEEMLDIVNGAKREWIAAQRYFDSVSEPALIDHAIKLSDAAQMKYMYLLHQANKQGLRAFDIAAQPLAEDSLEHEEVALVTQVEDGS